MRATLKPTRVVRKLNRRITIRQRPASPATSATTTTTTTVDTGGHEASLALEPRDAAQAPHSALLGGRAPDFVRKEDAR